MVWESYMSSNQCVFYLKDKDWIMIRTSQLVIVTECELQTNFGSVWQTDCYCIMAQIQAIYFQSQLTCTWFCTKSLYISTTRNAHHFSIQFYWEIRVKNFKIKRFFKIYCGMKICIHIFLLKPNWTIAHFVRLNEIR